MPTTGSIRSTASAEIMTLVGQYLALERAPLTRLQTSRTDLDARIETFAELKSSLRDLRGEIEGFRWPGALTPLNQFSATASDPQVVEIAASGSASIGHHMLTVESLARAHSIGSTALIGSEPAGLSGDYGLQITQGGERVDVNLSLTAGVTWRETLGEIAAAIRSAGAGVNVAVVTSNQLTDEVRLLLTSAESGTAAMIDAVGDVSGNLAQTLGLAGASTPETYAANTIQTAANAQFTIDGLAFVASGNQVDGALSGVTLTLLGTSSASVTLSVARDVDAVRSSVESFIETYNKLVDFVRTESQAADKNGENRGAFAGDAIFMGLRRDLRRALTDPVAALGESGAIDSLARIGITADRDGRLSISDPTAFAEALRSDAAEVDQLFRQEEDGIAVRALDLIQRHAATDGLIASRTDTLEFRGRLLDRRIDQMEDRLVRREKQLINYFSSLQSMMVQLVEQQNSLSGLS